MASKRLHLSISTTQYREIQKLADKLGMDVTNAIRHCLALAIDMHAEKDRREPPKKTE